MVVVVLCTSACHYKPVEHALEETSGSEHEPRLLVHNTISKIDKKILTATLTEPVDAEQCEYAGPVPDTNSITSVAVAWACEPVQNNVIIIPQYVYTMQPLNASKWNKYQSRCRCGLVLYSITYLRFDASSPIWILGVREVPMGTTCYSIEAPLCRKLRGLPERTN